MFATYSRLSHPNSVPSLPEFPRLSAAERQRIEVLRLISLVNEQLWIGHRDQPNQIKLRHTGDYPAGHTQGYPDAFKALFRAVYDAIEADEPPQQPDYPTFADGFEQVLVADAIAESARLETWVPVQR